MINENLRLTNEKGLLTVLTNRRPVLVTMINVIFTFLVTVSTLGIASDGQYPLFIEDYADIDGEIYHGRKCRSCHI